MSSLYPQARFLKAVARLDQAPPDQGREVAFLGRSNAGKSSVINALCQQRHLARTSKTPGRTQQLVFFQLDEERRLVDLPGYGYARVPLTTKTQWQGLMTDYLNERRSLAGLVLIMDVRHPLTNYDQQMIAWGRAAQLPLLLLLNKCDKFKGGAAAAQRLQVARRLKEVGLEAPVLRFSAHRRQGVEDLRQVLDCWLAVPTSS